ncbi:MAG: DUF2933 domain-containing protein [Burkholderiales bacterium]
MNAEQPHRETRFWRSKTGIALCAFLAVAAVLIVLEHRAHALQWLPFAILLACPLLHLFHSHSGHGRNGRHGTDKPDKAGGDGT